MQLYLESLLHQVIDISIYLSESADVVELHVLYCINDVFCYSRLLWLVQVKVPCVLFATHFYIAMTDCFPHSLSVQYTLGSFLG